MRQSLAWAPEKYSLQPLSTIFTATRVRDLMNQAYPKRFAISALGQSEEPCLGKWKGLVFSTSKDVVADTRQNRKIILLHTQDFSLEELFNSKAR